MNTMKKIMSMMLAMVMCMAAGIPTYAVGTDSVVSHKIEASAKLTADFASLDVEEPDIEPLAGFTPPTTNIFRIESFKISPVVLKDGKQQPFDKYVEFRPLYNHQANYTISLATQQKLIDLATAAGYEVVGWQLSASFYAECYSPIRVDYRIYNHEENGKVLYGKRFSTLTSKYIGTATISTIALFPNDMSQPYTYGFSGSACMNVYTKGVINRDYTVKATFEV